jgi:polysaccharide export outer membrane protein
MKKIRLLYIIAILGLWLNSCVSPSLMLRTPRNYDFSQFDSIRTDSDYVISVNDRLLFRIYSAEGLSYLDNIIASANGEGGSNASITRSFQGIELLVEFDSTVKVPIFKNIKIAGMTVRQAEKHLESLYAAFYEKPFVMLTVTNNRVIIFPGGDGGMAKVLPLQNTNTSLFEALALAGGISDGKARNIKLIRGDHANPEVYQIDLSKISGLKDGMTILKAGDIIYVTPRDKTATRILAEAGPWLALTTTTITTVLLFLTLFKK